MQTHLAMLGPDHPHTLDSQENVAWLYFLKGKYDQTETLYRTVVEGSRRTLGLAHPLTQMRFGNQILGYELRARASIT
jgi:hypothetical protein